MPSENTNRDALDFFLTGVAGDSDAHTQEGSLGGIRLPDRVMNWGCQIEATMHPILVDRIHALTTGTALISGDGTTSVTYTAPSGGAGTSTSIADAATELIEDATTSNAVVLSRDGADLLGGEVNLEIVPMFNNVIAGTTVTDAQRTAGADTYRGLIFRNTSALTVSNIAIWVDLLGTAVDLATSTTPTGLAASGASTINIDDNATTLADWPDAGWVEVVDSGGTIREIAYYTSRTATVLTVPAAGRGLLGTSAGAGAVTDVISPVPGIRLALETPDANGDIPTIANETTEPAGPPTWNSATNSTDGLTLASLAASTNHGLWIHREIPVNIVPAAFSVENSINVQFDYNAVTYTGKLNGRYRVINNAEKLYSLYIGEDTSPDFTAAPAKTSTTLPFTQALTPPGAGTKKFNHVIRYTNKYGLQSQNIYERTFELNTGGTEVTPAISAPEGVTLTNTDGGNILIEANYKAEQDASPANVFNVYVRSDGTDPVPATDTPTVVTMLKGPFNSPIFSLAQQFGPYPLSADVRVIVRAERTSDNTESENDTATSVTITTSTPGLLGGNKTLFNSSFGHPQTKQTISTTTIHDVTTDTKTIMTNGKLCFYVGSTLIWCIVYDSSDLLTWSKIFVPNDGGGWFIDATANVSRTGSTDVIEAASATEIYVNVNEVSIMKIDLTAKEISVGQVNATDTLPASVDIANVSQRATEALFQVYDDGIANYTGALEVESGHIAKSAVGWDLTTYTQAQIEAL